MSTMNENFGPGVNSTLKDLCYHLCSSLSKDETRKITRAVLDEIYLTSKKPRPDQNDSLENDDIALCANIEKQLISLGKQKDIIRFRFLNRKLLQREFSPLLTNRPAILSLFLNLSEGQHSKAAKEPSFIRKAYSPSYSKSHVSPSLSSPVLKDAGNFSGPSGCAINGDTPSRDTTPVLRPTTLSNNIFLRRDAAQKTPPKISHVQSLQNGGTSNTLKSYSQDSLPLFSHSPNYAKYAKTEVSESKIINELFFCFQGIEGDVLKLDHNGGFTLDPEVRVPNRGLVLRLAELGYLHNSVVGGCKSLEKGGIVSRAVRTAITAYLTDYYALIATLRPEHLESNKTSGDTPLSEEEGQYYCTLTLRSLYFFILEQVRLLQTLCEALAAIRNSRSLAVSNALEPLRHHGDPTYSHVITNLILHAGKPIIRMTINWLVEGELVDPSGEFFITINTNCQEKDIWRDKFILREDLIPNVMSEEQAQMILRSGKAVHFLNVICGRQTPISGSRGRLHNMKDVSLLDLADPRSELFQLITSIFVETSKQVLDTLNNQFKLFQHFQALRRYILLGQGDFVNYYMELVEPEMRKPASELKFHELMLLKAQAERGSLAHYDDPEVLNRVSVKVMVSSGGDWGSDVFGLQYLMHQPLDAALRLSEGAYSTLFNFLWRTKRLEYILMRLRTKRWATKNQLNWLAERDPAINGVLVLADRLSHELLHFAREFHHFIMFEVVECLWEKFSLDFSQAKSFDDVISAHDRFIIALQSQTFQDDQSRTFINELRLIWDLAFELESLEDGFFSQVDKECEVRRQRERRLEEQGTDEATERSIAEANSKFKAFLANMRAQYSILNRNYQEVLKKFLLGLSATKKHELRLLSGRLDYNGYYKSLDSQLTDSMKYSRCSELFS